jgi:hypothetical protein
MPAEVELMVWALDGVVGCCLRGSAKLWFGDGFSSLLNCDRCGTYIFVYLFLSMFKRTIR